jgi:hypothetical protein
MLSFSFVRHYRVNSPANRWSARDSSLQIFVPELGPHFCDQDALQTHNEL